MNVTDKYLNPSSPAKFIPRSYLCLTFDRLSLLLSFLEIYVVRAHLKVLVNPSRDVRAP